MLLIWRIQIIWITQILLITIYNANNVNYLKNINNEKIWNDINKVDYLSLKVIFIFQGNNILIEWNPEEKYKDLIERFSTNIGINREDYNFYLNSIELEYLNNSNLTLKEIGFKDYICINVVSNYIIGAGGPIKEKPMYNKEINIKFLKLLGNSICKNDNQDIKGILKLCLLKEVSQNLTADKLQQLPDILNYIMNILKKGYIIEDPNFIKQNIKDVLNKICGSNIINFSNYVDEIIDSNKLNKILSLLEKEKLTEMLDIKNRLSRYNKYIKLFNKEFEKSKRKSYLEFSVISLVVIQRVDFERFENRKGNMSQ